MDKPLKSKIQETLKQIRQVWPNLILAQKFIAFSGGKDSLALTAMIYEAIQHEPPPCIYVHHDMAIPEHLDYVLQVSENRFKMEILRPYLNYFELIDRGIGFLTLQGSWCKQLLIGTGFLQWLQGHKVQSPKDSVMFRGISGSEYGSKWHSKFEIYSPLQLPCFNPLLSFTKEEIVEISTPRYGMNLSPIYNYMDRTYCICCYSSTYKSRFFLENRFPAQSKRMNNHIESILFKTGLIRKAKLNEIHKTKEEKIARKGYIYWRRIREQDTVGAVKIMKTSGCIVYIVKNPAWIDPKHLLPLKGKWTRQGNEIRFWDCRETETDTIIKKMINCLDCGFCTVECLSHRRFDRKTKKLHITDCIQCGKCLRLTYCMGWQHRFWRRTVAEKKKQGEKNGPTLPL